MFPQRHLTLVVAVLALFMAVASAQVVRAAPSGSDVVFITKTGGKYHKDGCRYLKKSKIQTTRGEAEKKGEQPCKVCKP